MKDVKKFLVNATRAADGAAARDAPHHARRPRHEAA
jgi:hypothetical protein